MQGLTGARVEKWQKLRQIQFFSPGFKILKNTPLKMKSALQNRETREHGSPWYK